jgi:hypothetical protein
MDFLLQDIQIDPGHIVLMVGLFILIGIIIYKSIENFEGPIVKIKPCHNQACVDAVYNQAVSGQLFGCDPNSKHSPHSPEECYYQYRKALLHGCNVI